MKKITTIEKVFTKCRMYPVEITNDINTSHYFKKPLNKKGELDELSDFDICVKTFKVIISIYEE